MLRISTTFPNKNQRILLLRLYLIARDTERQVADLPLVVFPISHTFLINLELDCPPAFSKYVHSLFCRWTGAHSAKASSGGSSEVSKLCPVLRKDLSLQELSVPAKPKLSHLLLVTREYGLKDYVPACKMPRTGIRSSAPNSACHLTHLHNVTLDSKE